MDRRERIEHTEDTGTCFECGKPILEGEARYSPTHSHYDCHEKANGRVKDPFNMTEALELARSIDKNLDALARKLARRR